MVTIGLWDSGLLALAPMGCTSGLSSVDRELITIACVTVGVPAKPCSSPINWAWSKLHPFALLYVRVARLCVLLCLLPFVQET